MDEVFGEIMGLGYGSDSIMLRLLRSAMDEAHENVQSKDGPIELLNARSKFYEMAMILVEGCSKLIEEKTEIPEINREKMLSDLKESKDMVKGRLEDLKFSIVDRDIELVERIENEFRLRQTLESKEKELVSLGAKLKLERTKSEELERDGDFCDLKNSVDQQMLSIKQKLEDERMSLSSANDLFGDENFEESFKPEQNLVIEQMSSDIDCLKGTLDLAFWRMQNVEIGPLEKQWRWKIEKDTIFIAMNGFMSYLRKNFEVNFDQIRGNQIPFCFSSEQWSGFINEITNLHYELKAFVVDENETQEKYETFNICRVSSEPLPELNNIDKPNEDRDSESSTYVAKMKKYHESIIRKQHEELNWMKIRDIFRGKESSFGKKSKDQDNLGGRVKEVVSKLDNFVKWNNKVRDQICFREKIELSEKEKFGAEIKKLKQERDDLNMHSMLTEETYVSLLKGLIEDFKFKFQSYELESLMKDDICTCVFREMVNDLKTLFEDKSSDDTIESTLKEDLYIILFRNVINEFNMEIDCSNFEYLIREEIYNFIVLEAVKNEPVTEDEAHDQSPSKKSVHKEENLTRELDFSGKCYKNQEVLSLNDDLGLRNCDGEQSIYQVNWSVIVHLAEFKSTISGFELVVHQKLKSNFLRLEELTSKTQSLSPTIGSLRKEELLYKKGFEIRCHNLRLAEAEVDLLGDQVEDLLGLLEKIYVILNQDSTISSSDLRLSDIQKSIKKKLGRPIQ